MARWEPLALFTTEQLLELADELLEEFRQRGIKVGAVLGASGNEAIAIAKTEEPSEP